MLRLARGYLEERRLMEALVVAKKGAKEFPDFAVDFALLLAEVQVARGDRSQARAVLENALQSDRDDQRIRDALRDFG